MSQNYPSMLLLVYIKDEFDQTWSMLLQLSFHTDLGVLDKPFAEGYHICRSLNTEKL